MVDPRVYLKAGQDFHGHKCPALPLGLRVGAAAMNALGVDRATGRAVRVVPRAEVQAAQRQASFFKDYRSQGIPASAVPDEVVDPLVERVMSLPGQQLLVVGEVVERPVDPHPETFDSFTCDRCGEMVIEAYGRVSGDRKVCIPCAEALRAPAGR